MTSYSLYLSSGEDSSPVVFEAEDAAAALLTAHQLAPACSAELWRNGQKICSLDRSKKRQPLWLG
jgi:hypothetical protein